MNNSNPLETSKRDIYIRSLFSSIANTYDLLNRVLSFGRDRYWRRFTIQKLSDVKHGIILDVATGTGDMALEIVKRFNGIVKVIGVDFSEEMLRLAKRKIEKYGFQEKINLYLNNAQSLPFEDEKFDAVLIAFGIRNIADKLKGLSEMRRVVKEGGKIIILEFSKPNYNIIKWFYHLYFVKILPVIGGLLSKVKYAYEYLPESVLEFPETEDFINLMKKAGFKDIRYDILTYGVVTVYVGIR